MKGRREGLLGGWKGGLEGAQRRGGGGLKGRGLSEAPPSLRT